MAIAAMVIDHAIIPRRKDYHRLDAGTLGHGPAVGHQKRRTQIERPPSGPMAAHAYRRPAGPRGPDQGVAQDLPQSNHQYDTNDGLTESTGPGIIHLGMENMH